MPSTRSVSGLGSVTLHARLFHTATGGSVGNAVVEVLGRQGGTTAVRVVATGRTRADGLLLLPVVPRTSHEYQLRFRGTPTSAPALSPKAVVTVAPRITARLAPNAVLRGEATTLSGALAPAYRGVRLVLQRSTGSGWQNVGTLATAGDGRWSTRFVAGASSSYRVVLGATNAHLAAVSPVAALRVDTRDLRIGARGTDVLAVERALWEQGRADVGRVDGVFDADTLHGVIAFQKSQGMARTGVFERTTRARLAAHVQRAPRVLRTGRSVEIDLAQQVLRVFESGRLARLADVSTGNGERYVSQGVTYTATTPTGRFSITRKINGIRVSHLGELYRPAYFVGGFAVHGSPSVPTRPASHGCVRVTNSQMDRLYPLLVVGTPVTVYRS